MRAEYAFKVAANLMRYRTGKVSKWDVRGPYVPQRLIPLATKAQIARMDGIMGPKNRVRRAKIAKVRIDRLKSTQRCLKHKSLLWHIANFDRMQKRFRSKDIDIAGVNLPLICWSKGVPIIWNGNHRVTAALMLGKEAIWARVFRQYP